MAARAWTPSISVRRSSTGAWTGAACEWGGVEQPGDLKEQLRTVSGPAARSPRLTERDVAPELRGIPLADTQ
jgi:hypothetical protein